MKTLNELGRWEDDVKITFTEDEVKAVFREFVRVAYGLAEKDIDLVHFEYTQPTRQTTNREMCGITVFINTQSARPTSWESHTYRDVVKK